VRTQRWEREHVVHSVANGADRKCVIIRDRDIIKTVHDGRTGKYLSVSKTKTMKILGSHKHHCSTACCIHLSHVGSARVGEEGDERAVGMSDTLVTSPLGPHPLSFPPALWTADWIASLQAHLDFLVKSMALTPEWKPRVK